MRAGLIFVVRLCNPISLTNPTMHQKKSHNASFCSRNVHPCAHFCYKMVFCGIWGWLVHCGFCETGQSEIALVRKLACIYSVKLHLMPMQCLQGPECSETRTHISTHGYLSTYQSILPGVITYSYYIPASVCSEFLVHDALIWNHLISPWHQ